MTESQPQHDGRTDIPELEADETVAPRPEEEIADVARATPDPAGHGGGPEDAARGAVDGQAARLHP